jgi:hypothetical protein
MTPIKLKPFFQSIQGTTMQRQIIHGVPYFTDALNRLFTWDAEAQPQPIGTYHPTTNTITYADNHLAQLSHRLQTWRANQSARLRKPTASSGGDAGRQANGETNSEDED